VGSTTKQCKGVEMYIALSGEHRGPRTGPDSVAVNRTSVVQPVVSKFTDRPHFLVCGPTFLQHN
jgi:hypothetical protein